MSTEPQPPMRGRTGSRRDEDARLAVLHAADDLLAERGFAKTTVEGIAKRAGVAKQTVYRWWPSKTEILLDGLIDGVEKHLAGEKVIAARGGLGEYIERFRRFIVDTPDGRVFLALLGHAQHDAIFAATLSAKLLQPMRLEQRRLLRASASETSDAEADAVLDEALGAIVFRAMAHADR